MWSALVMMTAIRACHRCGAGLRSTLWLSSSRGQEERGPVQPTGHVLSFYLALMTPTNIFNTSAGLCDRVAFFGGGPSFRCASEWPAVLTTRLGRPCRPVLVAGRARNLLVSFANSTSTRTHRTRTRTRTQTQDMSQPHGDAAAAYPPGGAYPPQGGAPGGAYPPQQGAYPPGAFPPQAGYPQHGGAYPPQQGAYPGGAYPQQGAYPPQAGYPQQGAFPPGGAYPPGGAFPPQAGQHPAGAVPPAQVRQRPVIRFSSVHFCRSERARDLISICRLAWLA
jgi:hypothetical protein